MPLRSKSSTSAAEPPSLSATPPSSAKLLLTLSSNPGLNFPRGLVSESAGRGSKVSKEDFFSRSFSFSFSLSSLVDRLVA
jgi:hypothetical protein